MKRPEDPFPRVCESVTYGKSRNVMNDASTVNKQYILHIPIAVVKELKKQLKVEKRKQNFKNNLHYTGTVYIDTGLLNEFFLCISEFALP